MKHNKNKLPKEDRLVILCYKKAPRYEGMTSTIAYHTAGRWYNYRSEGFSHPLPEHMVVGWKYLGRWKEAALRGTCEVVKKRTTQAYYT